MELECDLGAIQSEELLRKMWQQSEDSERKRQIRSHLYKLRESRLRNLYRHEPDNLTFAMSEPNGNTLSGYAGKDPLATSHGDALLDQNFQSLKSKEVRDSMSPTHELKFHSMSLTQPNSTGWDVQTSSEVSPDGRAYRTETLAKTDGVEKLNGGGIAEFKGRNEQRSSASHQGDDKNYVKQAAESSNTHLQEKVVFGDESNGGRTEMKMSSTSSSSTSKFVSSSTVEYGDDDVAQPRYLLDNQSTNRQQHELREQREQREVREQRELREQREIREQRDREEQRVQEERFQEHRLQQQQEQREQREQREERFSESREQLKSTRNVETQQHYEENKRYVDMDKASPEYQRHVQHLMSQPGEIISNTVEYPKPNVKMITTVKRLPDGTIVKNKRYETEQVTPTADSVRQSQAQTQTQTQTQNNQRRVQETRDVVDNAEPLVRRPSETAEELVKQESYSTVKKSSRRYSTETTSETVQEYDDRAPQPSGRPDVPPSPRATNPIQEFPNHRPNTPNRPSDFSTHGFPSVRTNKPTQEFAGQRPTTEEYVVVKSEKSRNVKQSSSTTSQRTVETEFEPSWEQPQSPRRPTHVEDFSTHGFPSVRTDQPDAELPSSASRRPERIIETQVERERRPQQVNASPRRPQDSPTKSPTRKPNAATRTPPSRSTTETTTTTNTVTRRQLQKEREVDAAHRAFAASLRSSSPADSVGSTGSHHHPRRDSGQTPEPHPQRQAPRWSISSSSTNRRSGREGSHDSHAPSESSRISSTTVTRHVGVPKTIAKTTVSKQQQQQQQQTVVKTRSVQGSNETIDLTPQRLPKSPTAKSTTTTTTTTTTTIGNKPAGATPATPTKPATPTTPTTPTATSVPASEPSPVTDNQSQYTYATTKPADIFSLPPTNPTTPTINNNNNNNNETTTTTTLTTKNKKPSTSTSTSNDELLTKTKLSSNEATTTTTTTSAVHEPPCVRRNYYKLGPADATSEVPAQVADIAKAVTSTETVDRSRPTHQSSPGRTVASRRNIFEKHSPSPTTTTTTTSATTEPSGRRPSYMDHTKSSLEHIRRDSLEINKTHYSRKSSVDDETMLEPRNPNAAVKFDVPKRGSRPEAVRTTNTDELEIEEIFDLQTLEQLLETVSSYELRRRIRAQIRLIKKNMINANSSTTITTTTITTKGRQSEQLQPRSQSSTPSRSPMPVRRMPELPRERSQSPEAKGSTTTSTTTTCRRTEQLDSGKPPVKPRDRSASPVQTRRRSPTGKSSSTTTTTTTRTTKQAKVNPNEKPSPIWADRSKVLRASGSHSPTSRKGSNTSTTSSSSRVMRSSNITSSSTTTTSSSSSSKRREEDSITSSYGVGPTDENGLPLFGIRALKKKTQPPVEPCETKQEVTGYVIEEQFYSDDKSPPRHERKELIYSSNPDELVTLQQQLDTAQPDGQTTKLEREVKLIDVQGMPAAIEPPSGKRRGSIKELSERFIHKESMLADEETEDSESNDVCSVIELEAPQMRQHQTSSTTRTSSSTRSFLNTSGEERAVSSVDDVLERMRNADNVVEPGDSAEDREARALLNKFLGASVIMQGVESMLPAGQRQQQLSRGNISSNSNSSSSSQAVKTTQQQRSSSSSNNNNNNISSSSSNTRKTTTTSSAPVTRTTCDIEAIWDEQLLRQLLEQASTYEERRKIRARLRELMAEREEVKSVKAGGENSAAKEAEEESSASEYEEIIEEVTDDSSDEEEQRQPEKSEKQDKEKEKEKQKEEQKEKEKEKPTKELEQKLAKVELSKEQVDGAQAQHKQQSSTTSERTETKSKDGGAIVTTTTTKVTTRTVSGSAANNKNISPLAKFKQLDKAAQQQQAQKSSPTTSTPTTPGGSAQPYFKFTDPALNARAATVKDQLLQWCQHKTQEYENVQISNFSSSWSDGLAFCALIHHFLPDAFDYSQLTKQTRKHNFELAFSVADEKAGIAPLLDVEDMVEMSRPDWKCVFVYVQSIYRRFRNCQ
ncbi:mucin-5AC isoform X8 [Drosophila mojavensis]|uniref:mucin-5AC isoform X8 n=1 Tax=Drosophila mojavensis TaxID=7230 RepID=UPI001CD0D2BC|nr:mucin-5AC isoform X8 [Drosophila mojavensis]